MKQDVLKKASEAVKVNWSVSSAAKCILRADDDVMHHDCFAGDMCKHSSRCAWHRGKSKPNSS